MADFLVMMKGTASDGDWEDYIEKLVASGGFRGGSSLGNGVSVAKGRADRESEFSRQSG